MLSASKTIWKVHVCTRRDPTTNVGVGFMPSKISSASYTCWEQWYEYLTLFCSDKNWHVREMTIKSTVIYQMTNNIQNPNPLEITKNPKNYPNDRLVHGHSNQNVGNISSDTMSIYLLHFSVYVLNLVLKILGVVNTSLVNTPNCFRVF
jgi:hypothetical protein